MRHYLDFLWTRRTTLVLLALTVVFAGWAALKGLPRSVFPDIEFPRVTILVSDANLPVKYMLLEVTEPLEQAAKGVADVSVVKSQSGIGLSKLHVYFNTGINPQTAYLLLQARLAQIPLPGGARMTVRLMTPHIQPFAEYALVSERYSSSDMMPLYAFNVRPALLSARGVYQVDGIGRGWPQLDVSLSLRRLAEHGLSAAEVVTALRRAQGPYYAGLIRDFHQQFVIVNSPRPQSVKALERLELPLGPREPDAAPTGIALGALGSIRLTPPPMITAAAVAGYRHALLIDVSAQAGANVVGVAREVRARVRALRAQLPSGVHLVRVYDFSRLIQHSLRDVWVALLLGSAIAWLVVMLFLRRLDTALATLTVIPLALAGTFVVLRLLGYGINIMTLGGLTASVGALVDHAIVVMERGMRGASAASDRRVRRNAALAACGEILPLMTLATLTSTVIFVPLVFLSGTLGLLFRHMAVSIVVALLVSQLVALTVTPMLAAWLAQRPHLVRKPWRWARLLRLQYDRLLRAGMRRPWAALPAMLALGAGGFLCALQLPTAFLPHWDEGAIAVPFRTPVGTPTQETLATARLLAAAATRDPQVSRVSVVVGRSLENARSTSNKGDLVIILKRHRRQTTSEVMQTLRKVFRQVAPDLIELKLHQIMSNRLENLSGAHSPLSVLVFGPNPAVLERYGKLLQRRVGQSGDFENVVFKSPSAGPEIVLTPRTRARFFDLTPAALAAKVRASEWGRTAGFLLRGEQIMPIRVQVHGLPRAKPTGLSALPLRLPDGTWVPLSEVAHVRPIGSVPYVTHDNLVPYAYLQMAPKAGQGLTQAAAELRTLIAGTHRPPGVSTVVGGYYREQARSFNQMALILAGALLILLILFGLQFASQRAALAGLLAMAFAAPGVFFALKLSGTALDSTAFLGLLLVLSIAVNNIILIFSLARHRGGCLPDSASVVRSARVRLRPILMTMLADVLGFLPIAVGIGHGTDLLKPLAIAVMGGLSLAVFASLWLAPVLYAGMLRTLSGASGWRAQLDADRRR